MNCVQMTDMAVGQHQWYHFGVGAPPNLVVFSGDWDVHLGVRGFDPVTFIFFGEHLVLRLEVLLATVRG